MRKVEKVRRDWMNGTKKILVYVVGVKILGKNINDGETH
jgi:hypothetical protein